MDRPKARPRNFLNAERQDGDSRRGERDRNDNDITPEKRPRRDHRDRTRNRSGGRGVRESTVENDSDLDAAELNRKIERLHRDLTRRDRELESERHENEKAMDKIKKLEMDKVELKREIEDFRLEAEEYKRTLDEYKAQMRSRSESYSPAESESGLPQSEQNGNERHYHRGSSKNNELVIAQKNREISQLLEDVEKLDEDKLSLQDTVTQLKDNLADATNQIEAMANDHFNLKSKLDSAEDQIRLLDEEKTVLQIKEKDLMGFKERHEQYLDNLCKAVDVRVDIWKKMMLEKDEEINRLNSKVETLLSQIPDMQLDSELATIRHLQAKLVEREEQILQLSDELAKATDDVNSNIKEIERLQSKLSVTEDAEKTEKIVQSLQARVKKLEEKLAKKDQLLKAVEKEAEVESSEHAALLAKIRAYESGEYGLPEAIVEIKDLKVQVRIRDKQVESVTQEINILQMQVHDFEDENEMLRDKLGLERNVDVSRETKRYIKSRKNEIIALRHKVTQLEDTKVHLKTMNYSLKKQVAQLELSEQQSSLNAVDGETVMTERANATVSQSEEKTDVGIQTQSEVEEEGRMDDSDAKLLDENDVLENSSEELKKRIAELENNLRVKDQLINAYQQQSSHNSVDGEMVMAERDNAQVSPSEEKIDVEIQTELEEEEGQVSDIDPKLLEGKDALENFSEELKKRIGELENILRAKDQLINAYQQQSLHNAGDGEMVMAEQYNAKVSQSVEQIEVGIQTESEEEEGRMNDIDAKLLEEKDALENSLEELKKRIDELENNLRVKDQLISGLDFVKASHPEEEHSAFSDLQEALEVARETIESLQERLKSKEESIGQYRKLLAEVRKEMTNASDRHVQEMRQMQLTIHQQQQAFTRMKSTLSQPVKDTTTIEGTIKDQLTRIHELEDEVSQLQHTLANVASQLTAARSDAHRWRCTAEVRLKEVEQSREHFSAESMEEVQSLRRKLKDSQIKLEKAEEQLHESRSVQQRDSLSDLVSILRKELEEKDKQIGVYLKTLNSTTFNEKSHFEGLLNSKEREIDMLKEEVSKHLKSISSLQLRLSKTKAISIKTGASTELEDIRMKFRELQDEKVKLEKDLQDIHSKRDEDESKRIKTAESFAKWEESKKWKKNKERLESRVKELELENSKLEKMIAAFKSSIHRLEKEKMILDSRLKSRQSFHGSSISKSSLDNMSDNSAPSGSYHQSYIIAQGEIAKLQLDLQDMKELVEKTEFEGREEVEKLKMEIRCLKERIVTQERQLTAYEIAQKGDPEVVHEIQKMAAQETEFQKEVVRLEEDNLHLRLQIEQLQLETPRLRDRVQHLQKIVDALKVEKSMPGQKSASLRSLAQKPLGELERTITALKQVIEKLQAENQRLKKSRSDLSTVPRITSERLKSSVSSLMDEKRALVDRVQSLEQETEKYQRLYMEKCSVVDTFDSRLQDAEKRAKSSEMKLKAFLDDRKTSPHPGPGPTCSSNTCHGYNILTQKVQKLEEDILQKSKVLQTAKQTLKDVERLQSMVPHPPPTTQPRSSK